MRIPSIAGALALVLLAWPALAQDDGSRVLVEATLKIAPDEVEAHCLPVDAGTLEVSVAQIDGRVEHPIGRPRFALGPHPAGPAPAGALPEIEGITVTAAPTTTALPVESGLYCYSVSIAGTPEIDGLAARERAAYSQSVAITMVLTPR